MGLNNTGFAKCLYCGAEYRLFTIFNRDMQGLCKAWKGRHERGCFSRSPAQRRKWAKPYIGKDQQESSIVVDLANDGFIDVPNAKLSRRGTETENFKHRLSPRSA